MPLLDRADEQWLLPFAERLCVAAAIAPGDQVLDVGTGVGLAARAAARRVGGGGKVLGVDPSQAALDAAEARGRREGLVPHILRLQQMPADRLSLRDGSVDVVLSLFGSLQTPACAEIRRVLRPGGRLVVAVAGEPPLCSARGWSFRGRRAWDRRAAQMGIRLDRKHLQRLVDGHLPPSSAATRGALERILAGAGFGPPTRSWGGVVHRADDPDAFWTIVSGPASPLRERIEAAPPAQRDALRAAALQAGWEVLDRGGRLVSAQGAWYVSAHAP